ncbi:DUF2309 domain-containing protein [Sulfitobacter sp. HNIBRBA3233]|uniref:YbcC family protein n=1 Tax=Sulfitobacter marinivivus TaxID=3158558 RepID=UPI0032DFD533
MTRENALPSADLMHAADAAGRAIPPVWPLASSVAVNPFLGQTGETLATTGARLARVAGVPVAMPRDWYQARIADGRITDDDLAAALAAAPAGARPVDLDALKKAAQTAVRTPKPLPTVADLAADASRLDWPALIAERLGAWSASYFDAGQALWAAPRRRGPWNEWRAVASHDLTPEIQGLRGFAAHAFDAPETAEGAIARAAARLGLSEAMLETYFHQLLMTLGGWAQFARYRLWQAELAGGTDPIMAEILAIRLTWEEALFIQYEDEVADEWARTCAAHAQELTVSPDLIVDEILQEAAERAGQRDLAALFASEAPAARAQRPALQAAFCIDVRSEVFRRALEAVDPAIETIGFAGFFGIGTKHRGFGSDVDELRLPVLLNPSVSSRSGGEEQADEDLTYRFAARATRAWGRFKMAAVSSFAFVEAMGPIYAGKLVRDGLGMEHASLPDGPAPQLDPALDLDARITAAETVLRAMSLTENFARVVMLAGHGANVTNNPHASALHCGACGGYSGEVNARILAQVLNDREVRAALPSRGITVPEDTVFLAALHDTTTDAVKIYDKDTDASAHQSDLRQVKSWLEAAGQVTRAERALRLPRAEGGGDVAQRSRDWAEVRPEWALAGCKAFIAAPRSRTAGRSLEGRAFLHNYDWRADSGFGVLELILTAPVVVASWISLQYYGSTVAPSVFGGGNKLLHNVTGGIGVIEGNGGLLRAGLPWQSVHDGEDYAHEPLRLSVCIEAPREAMTDILRRHEGVRALFDNRWLHLFALDDAGQMAWRYTGGLEWEAVDTATPKADVPHLKEVV